METISRFIDQIDSGNEYDTEYSAGIVSEQKGNGFSAAWGQYGAIETFSIGQPVFDGGGNLMGYLGISLYSNLDYSAKERIPVEYWKICLPTEYCREGQKVYTYWQNKKRMGASDGR